MTRIIAVAAFCLAALFGSAAIAKATPDQNAALYEAMHEAQIELNPIAYSQAYQVCSLIQAGKHPMFVTSMVAAGNPDWYFEQAQAFVGASILIYCPPDSPTVLS